MLQYYLYVNSIRGFLSERGVYGKMQTTAKARGLSISENESESWKANIKALKELFRLAMKSSELFLDSYIMLEVCISEKLRADCIIMGNNAKEEATVVVMELKQWSDDFISKPENEGEIRAGKIMTNYSFGRLSLHPSKQVSDYRWNLNNYPAFLNRDIKHAGMAYCYNCEKGMQTYKVLYDKDYDDYIKDCKPYTQKTKEKLINALLNHLQCGCGQEVYNRLK